ncbi:response regulator [Paenibacillus sp. HB172176]|uniref:response regulator n=1 Tax=Paenibacillus sp. HB172176 TaxID=2493690 RepID=UPI00143B3036|nr:response regulator [Paenibacillus sp. HB172176]
MWKIAIIDDDFQVLRGLRSIIPWEELDAEFVGDAIDGEHGLELVRKQEPDIVITDLYMPGISGIDMIQQLRSENRNCRFIILSGYTDFEYARQAIRLDVDDYLNKPITIDQLRKVLLGTIQQLEETYLEKMEKTELLHSLRNYELMRSEEQIAGLLTGKVDQLPSDLELPGQPEWWHAMDQQVLLLELVKTERVSHISIADWHLFRFAMSNVIEELLGQEWPQSHFSWLYGPISAVVLHMKREELDEALESRIEALSEKLIDTMNQFLKLKVAIGVGSRQARLAGLKESADRALEDLHEWRSPAALQLVDVIAQALDKSSEEELWQSLMQYISQWENVDGAEDGVIIYKVLAAELTALFLYAVERTGLRMDEQAEGALYSQPDTVINRGDLEGYLQAMIRRVQRTQKPVIAHKHRAAVDTMIQYIHENYASDITLDELAGQLFISKNYLNQLFKKVTGETFMNYVIRVRLEKAKSLLLEGDLLIYEVAEQVGYQNVPYFSTLFKKYCGVNPSELLKK